MYISADVNIYIYTKKINIYIYISDCSRLQAIAEGSTRLLTTGGDTLGLYQTTHDWWRYLRAALVVIVKNSY